MRVFLGTTAKTIATTPESVWLLQGCSATCDAGDDCFAGIRAFGAIAVVSGAYTFSDVTYGVPSNVRPARFFVFGATGIAG